MSDRFRLRGQLTVNSSEIERVSKRLGAAYPAYKESLGKHPGPVLKEIVALAAVVRHAIRAVEGIHLATDAARHAQGIALGALRALQRGLTDLHSAFSTHDEAVAKLALGHADAHAKQCEQLRAEASKALGFPWRL